MPEIRDERVYLSKTESVDFVQELLAAYELADGKRIVIDDDRSKPEAHIDVYINAYKSDENSNKIFEIDKWFNLVLLFINSSEFIQIGIWKNQMERYKKILEELVVIEEEVIGDQIELKILVRNNETIKWIEQNFKSDGSIAFFNFTMYAKEENDKFIFSASHFGEENRIEGLESKQLEDLLRCIDGDYFFVRISDCYKS